MALGQVYQVTKVSLGQSEREYSGAIKSQDMARNICQYLAQKD